MSNQAIYDLSSVLSFKAVLLLVALQLALLPLLGWRRALPALACIYWVLIVLSNAPLLPYVALAKYGRVYISGIMVLIGVWAMLRRGNGPGVFALMALSLFHAAAALWSASPLWGVAFKSFFFFAAAAGVCLAYSLKTESDLRALLRMLVATGGATTGCLLLAILPNLDYHINTWRLAPWGMIANTFAVNLAVIVIMATHLSLHDPSRRWRLFAAAVIVVLSLVIVWTGSRSGFLTATIGSAMVLFPARRARLWGMAIATAAAVIVTSTLLWFGQTTPLQRVLDIRGDRLEAWAASMEFLDSPLFGRGWIVTGGWNPDNIEFVNTHNSYLHGILESGAVGIVVFLFCAIGIAITAIRAQRVASRASRYVRVTRLVLAILIVVALEALVGNATIAAAQSTTLFLGFAVACLDLVARCELFPPLLVRPALQSKAGTAFPATCGGGKDFQRVPRAPRAATRRRFGMPIRPVRSPQ